ncbi:MAG TPA: carboxypeptidase-like regulatory domain-containing protein [Ktedonobacteraceae bacterium]
MIDQTDRVLTEWVKGVVTGVDVVLGLPYLLEGKTGISLYLLALAAPSSVWVHRQPATQVTLRYLVTAWAPDEEQAHRLLGKLVLAGLEKREYELDLIEPPITLWTALGLVPRPAFIICLPLLLEPAGSTTPLVSRPLALQGVPTGSLYGTVLGPGDIPIAGAGVELPALQLSTHTDSQGIFFFATVPVGAPGVQLVVKAKGQVQRVTLEHPASAEKPLEIRFISFSK